MGVQGISDLAEKRMFGGLVFLYKGKMTIGVIKNDLAVRIREEKFESILAHDHVRQMDFTKKPMKNFVYVTEEGFPNNAELQQWIELGLEHARVTLKEIL